MIGFDSKGHSPLESEFGLLQQSLPYPRYGNADYERVKFIEESLHFCLQWLRERLGELSKK